MGRCDTAAVSLGLQVGLQALLDQTTDANFQQVAEILRSDRSFIEDENDYYNESLREVQDQLGTYDNAEAFRLAAQELLLKHGNVMYHRFTNTRTTIVSEEDNLLKQTLLVPVVKLVETSRWGYTREGINGQAVPLADYAKSVVKIRQDHGFLSDFEVVLMVSQNAF